MSIASGDSHYSIFDLSFNKLLYKENVYFRSACFLLVEQLCIIEYSTISDGIPDRYRDATSTAVLPHGTSSRLPQ